MIIFVYTVTIEQWLATAATNGAVVLWNIPKSMKLKQEMVYYDHKRTVNKVRDVRNFIIIVIIFKSSNNKLFVLSSFGLARRCR